MKGLQKMLFHRIMHSTSSNKLILHTFYTHISTCTHSLTHTHTHTHTGNERRDRRVAASIQFQRGDAIIFKIGDKEMEGEIANLYVSPGCHLVRCYKNYKNILFDNIISFFPILILYHRSICTRAVKRKCCVCVCIHCVHAQQQWHSCVYVCVGGKYQPKTLHSNSHISTVVSLY